MGADSAPCVRCHELGRRGRVAARPGHGACFGDCHGPPPSRLPVRARADGRRDLCRVCHGARGFSARWARSDFAVPTGALSRPEWALQMPHARHAEAAACLDCHQAPSDAAADAAAMPKLVRSSEVGARAHERCVRCHRRGGSDPDADAPDGPGAIDACAGCHIATGAGPAAPRLVSGVAPARYSHARHRARGLDDCGDCHVGAATATGNTLPAPSTEQCAGCHDGERAFSVVGTSCRRCHATPGRGWGPRPARGPTFSHQTHREHGLDLACTACHTLDSAGRPQPPGADHAPCADAGCHRDDFASTSPRTCGACHVGIEPDRHLYFAPRPRTDTEFGARFSHRAHATLGRNECTSCHTLTTGRRQMRVTVGHDGCAGADCHDPTAPTAPAPASAPPSPPAEASPAAPPPDPPAAENPGQAARCAPCHVVGLARERRQARLSAPWSVRARFRHRRHMLDPRDGSPLACAACHEQVADADDLAAIPGPGKHTCTGCHDGVVAFKVTGHGCARCHGTEP
ncbi:cytochrome c3 family protein [Haliangium sp.]|uniref:cytochrome c3 family protein n=1 Tax=Haliangium sp. TaxID=2663208 RepID=UPI003D0DF239